MAVTGPVMNRYPDTTHPLLPNEDAWDRFRRDIELLIIFATDGVPIISAACFAPSCTPGPFARNYRDAPAAVEAHIHKAWKAGLGILLTPAAAASIDGSHDMRSSVAAMKGK